MILKIKNIRLLRENSDTLLESQQPVQDFLNIKGEQYRFYGDPATSGHVSRMVDGKWRGLGRITKTNKGWAFFFRSHSHGHWPKWGQAAYKLHMTKEKAPTKAFSPIVTPGMTTL